MKHLLGIVTLSVVLQATSCGTTYHDALEQKVNSAENSSTDAQAMDVSFGGGYFTELLSWENYGYRYAIVYANDTKVKYFVCRSAYSSGVTPLYNADGSLQVYEENSQ